MNICRDRLFAWLVITLLAGAAGGIEAGQRVALHRVGAPVGGGIEPDAAVEHPSEEQRLRIEEALERNIQALDAQGRLSEAAAARPLLGWPLAPVNGLSDFGYHTTFHLVDLDPAFPNQVLDYACGSRTYDSALGYNHQGVDYVVWPFRWTRFRDSQVAVVAAAPGTIVFREDGNPDFDCTGERTLWNAVYVRHADGSTAWYGHLKNGSLTTKSVGESVSRGEYLGLVGASGVSTGPHLHFEVHDSMDEVIEPHEGACNNVSSWWDHQPPYFDSAINKLATGPAPPIPFAACPGSEAPNEETNFAPGSTIYFTAYYRDQRNLIQDPGGATTHYAIYGPDGRVEIAWSHSSPADHYVGSWWTFEVFFPENTEPGIYRWEAVYQGVTYSHYFRIGCPPQSAGRCRGGRLIPRLHAERSVERPAPFAGSNSLGAGGGNRTLTGREARGILSPLRLPIPPLRHG